MPDPESTLVDLMDARERSVKEARILAASRHHLCRECQGYPKMTDHRRVEALVAGAVGKRLTLRPVAP